MWVIVPSWNFWWTFNNQSFFPGSLASITIKIDNSSTSVIHFFDFAIRFGGYLCDLTNLNLPVGPRNSNSSLQQQFIIPNNLAGRTFFDLEYKVSQRFDDKTFFLGIFSSPFEYYIQFCCQNYNYTTDTVNQSTTFKYTSRTTRRRFKSHPHRRYLIIDLLLKMNYSDGTS